MRSKIFFIVLLLAFLSRSTLAEDEKEAENDASEADDKTFKHFCSFEKPMLNHSIADDDDFCNCDVFSSPMIGRPLVKIDCTLSAGVTNLTNAIFKAENLPINAVSLILSYQLFTEVPDFVGSLVELDMSNNRISVIKDLNFIHIKTLEKLDLSYNEINEIQVNAFSLMNLLHHLDLSSNQLVVVPANVFAPLVTLETLKLSMNDGFGRMMGKDVVNSSLTDLYLHLGVTPNLRSLEMERCNLTKINLLHGAGLENVNLGFNAFEDLTRLELPSHIKMLEISGNPVRKFTAHSLSHFYLLEELIMEDMPYLGQLDEYSLYGLPQLRRLSLEGSKNLSLFHHFAFGMNVIVNETDIELRVLNLRGCNLRNLNFALVNIFENLKELHLEGNPFTCDCEVAWIKDLKMETNLQCRKPDEYAGKHLHELKEKQLNCSRMSLIMKKAINCLILLLLLVGCSLAIWCFFQQLNPRNRRKRLQKVGPGPTSPYQRVTIEPNRAEYSMY